MSDTAPPSADWKTATWSCDVEQGSALDFSSLLDGPAGKYGRLIVRNGHFAFVNRPEQSVRFYGVNLCGAANFPDKPACHQLVDRLVACGYNSVRFHHHDHRLTEKTGERATEIDPVEMDKLDYLFHCLKQRGIYLTTDLFVSRRPKQIFAELGRPIATFDEFKFLIHLTDDAYQNWEDYARNFLTHVNAYTGLAWKDDPALITLNCVNEAAIFHCYRDASPDVRRIYDHHFTTWLGKHEQSGAAGDERTALLNRFLVETCSQTMARMRAFIDSLGCKTLITEQNHWSIIPMSLLRQPCDFVDDHFYWDHPEQFPLPSKLLNSSSLTDLFSIFSGIFPGRLFGKPYTISEYNWVYPNQHRAEGAPLTAAYAALQDWDGLYRFDYLSSAVDQPPRSGYFNIAADPINSLSDRIGVLLFLRGDVKRSDAKIPLAVSSGHMQEKTPTNTYPNQLWKLGFVGQIGTVVESVGKLSLPPGAAFAVSVNDELKISDASVSILREQNDLARIAAILQRIDLGAGRLTVDHVVAKSTTGELTLDEAYQTFTIATERTEVLVFTATATLTGRVLTARNLDGPAVVCLSSLDGASLAESRRMLLMHLTDAIHHDTTFEGNVITQWGNPPHLVRRGEVDLSLKMNGAMDMTTIWALDFSGKRITTVDFEWSPGGTLNVKLDTHAGQSPRMLYEIVRDG